MQVFWLVALALCFDGLSAQTIDRSTGVRVPKPWLEAGYSVVDDVSWTSARSAGRAFTNNIVILVALPDLVLGGPKYTEGNATATRIRNIVSNSSGVFFQIKVRHITIPCVN
jgi:hypothetical protein